MSESHSAPATVAVLDARESAALDEHAVAAGIPSRALMQRAGAAVAALVAERFASRLSSGVLVATGPGNNGGDGWVVAHALHALGIPVRVVECVAAKSPDAVAERERALAAGVAASTDPGSLLSGGESLVVDALLGTGLGTDGRLRDAIAVAVDGLRTLRARGCAVVAVDLPTGLDATTGADAGGLRADLTVTFASVKRGHLVARDACGTIVVVDIGLSALLPTRASQLVTPRWFRNRLPLIAADAHKGTRGKVAIIGGAPGMAGATVLAARGALRSGAGMVRCVVAPQSVAAVQEAEPLTLTAPWPSDDAAMRRVVTEWADVVLIGPGLGRDDARAMVERLLENFAGPVVLDADALFAFSGDAQALAPMLKGRPALLTPHAVEFARLAGLTAADVLERRFELPRMLAARTGAAVLLKGVPTIVSAVDGAVTCVAEGTPILATGGSGDILGGMAAALLASVEDAATAGALAAFAHGRAASAVSARQVRGFSLDDVLAALPSVWGMPIEPARPPILAELAAVGELPVIA